VLLAAGFLLYTATAFATTRAYEGERVPRLGFWPAFGLRSASAWIATLGLIGGLVMIFSTGKLTGYKGWQGPGLLFGCITLSWLAQVGVVLAHNRRHRPGQASLASGDGPAPGK
jgi:hypothetical protein